MKNYFFCVLSLWCLLVLGVGGCGLSENNSNPSTPEAAQKEWEKTLTFNDVTLEQVDAEGKMVWKVRSPSARYNDEQKVTYVKTPTGELFQDGKLVYRIEAKSGEVYGDGKKIILKDDIIATATEHNAVLRGKELEWLPQEDLLVVRNNLSATHPEIDVSANEARVQSRAKQMELLGQVIATTKKPVLQMRSDRVMWQMDKHLVTSDRPVEIERYTCNSPQNCPATDTAVADGGQVNIKTQIVELQNNAKLTLAQPPLNVDSDIMVWNVEAQTIASDRPVTILHREQELTFTGGQGKLELEPKIFYLTGGVTGVGGTRQSDLKADQVTWFIPTEEIQAEGNVVYRQADPPFTVTGPKAFGKLQDQTVVVTGGNVVTEVIP